MPKNLICQICNKTVNRIGTHLIYNHPEFTPKSYYDAYIQHESICHHPECNKEPKFININVGYLKHCSMRCKNSNPSLAIQVGLKGSRTKRDNPNIITNAVKKYKQTIKNDPMIGLNRIEKIKQTIKNDPSIEQRRRDNISISRRNYYKSISENSFIESHYLYIMEHQSKPIIKIGLCSKTSLERRTKEISRHFGESKPIHLLNSTYKKIDDLESFLHDYFKEHCKVQPEKKSGRTEWFDKIILNEVLYLLENKSYNFLAEP